MLQPVNESRIPGFESLPKIKPSELKDELKQLREATKARSQGAITKMVAFVSVTKGKCVTEIGVADILRPEVASAMLEYSKTCKVLKYQSRVIYCALGAPDLIPQSLGNHWEYHPWLINWLSSTRKLPRAVPTVGGRCMRFLQWLCEHTAAKYRPHEYPLAYIQRRHLVEYRYHLLSFVRKGQKSKSTAKAELSVVVRWLKWLMEKHQIGLIDVSHITIGGSESRERRIPVHLQISKFMELLMSLPINDSYILFFLLLLATGARPIELRTLTVNCIDFDNHSIRLQSKNGPERWVPLGVNLWTILVQHLNKPENVGIQYVLHGRTGCYLQHSCCDDYYQKAKHQSGVDIDGLMAFRHRFATDCYENKIPTHVFQYLMGHRTSKEMKRYQHRNEYLDNHEIEQAVVEWLGDLK